MDKKQHTKFRYLLQLADNVMILGQRLGEWCGHGPVLEQDIAVTNIALDLIGQARSYYQYAAELQGEDKTEDDLAFLRDNRSYYNVQLVEQPNGDFAHTMVRQFFFDTYNFLMMKELTQSNDERLAAIAKKSIKEVAYHVRYSSEWVIRLGDGTEESHNRMQTALDNLWMYHGELLMMSPEEKAMAKEGIGVDLHAIKPEFDERIKTIIEEATLKLPQEDFMQQGGKTGFHTEHLGHILSEMQWMQRTYPNLQW